MNGQVYLLAYSQTFYYTYIEILRPAWHTTCTMPRCLIHHGSQPWYGTCHLPTQHPLPHSHQSKHPGELGDGRGLEVCGVGKVNEQVSRYAYPLINTLIFILMQDISLTTVHHHCQGSTKHVITHMTTMATWDIHHYTTPLQLQHPVIPECQDSTGTDEGIQGRNERGRLQVSKQTSRANKFKVNMLIHSLYLINSYLKPIYSAGL